MLWVNNNTFNNKIILLNKLKGCKRLKNECDGAPKEEIETWFKKIKSFSENMCLGKWGPRWFNITEVV